MIPRSYTFFAAKDDLLLDGDNFFLKIANTVKTLNAEYASSRTLRFTLPEISLDNSEDFDADIALASKWYLKALENNMRWVNQPFSLKSRGKLDPYTINIITNLLTKHEKLFASLNITRAEEVETASQVYAKISKSLSRSDSQGFNNFRFGIGFNITEYTPFFPFSQGSLSGFSVALESLDFLKKEMKKSIPFRDIEKNLLNNLKNSSDIFNKVGDDSSLTYHGSDWSLAPLPNGPQSVVNLINSFGGTQLGIGGGFLSSVAKMTQFLKSPLTHAYDSSIKPVGFNGVMFSVLEDDALAKSFALRGVTVNDLLLFSTVCGCGLDMVPISGDTSELSISAYAEDTASIAFRLNKPLGVRFMPIAKLRDGQQTSFSHDFVNNSSVIRL